MKLQFEYVTHVVFSAPVSQHNLLLRCLPAETSFQHVSVEEFCLPDLFWHEESVDGLGNRIVVAGTSEMHTELQYGCRGVVESTVYCERDEAPSPTYRMSSRLTPTEGEMRELLPSIAGRFLDDCLALTHVVHQYVVYTPGVTNMLTTSSDVFRHRKGVCQDYAHLMIALCRLAGMTARYACGLMRGEGQTHAWVEVHDGQCWYAFDPTNDCAVATGYIKLAHGRDAMDCPVSRGIYTGVACEKTTVNVIVKEI